MHRLISNVRRVAIGLGLGTLALASTATNAEPPRDGLRVAAWNITFYNGGLANQLRTVVYGEFEGRRLDPDVILLQEMTSSTALDALVGHLNAAPESEGDWVAAPFFPRSSIECAIVYRSTRVSRLSSILLHPGGPSPNHPRNISRHDFTPVGYDPVATRVAMYSSHMKAGASSSDQARKALEGQRIRTNAASLPAHWHKIYGGDTNIRTSLWAGWQNLTSPAISNGDGLFVDPINTPGNWNNSSAFRFVHTQDPVGGGGMDDRFDVLLLSETLVDGEGFDYIGDPSQPFSTTTWDDPNHSYRAYGNDGTSFNDALTTNGNAMVGPAIAQAIIDLGDNAGHIPVYLDLQLPAIAQVTTPAGGTLVHYGTVELAQTEPIVRTLTLSHAGDIDAWGVGGLDDLDATPIAEAPFTTNTNRRTLAPGSDPVGIDVALDLAQVIDTPTAITRALTLATNDPAQPELDVTLVVNVLACLADWDSSGAPNILDVIGFLDAWSASDLATDLDGNAMLNVLDVLAFITRWNSGCP